MPIPGLNLLALFSLLFTLLFQPRLAVHPDLSAPGDLDTTFNSTGYVRTSLSSGDDSALAVAIQTDHKIVVAGWAETGVNKDFALARYNENGSLDSSFGSGGKVVTSLVAGDDEAEDVVIQPDGKIVVCGTIYGSKTYVVLARYTTTGALDPAFGYNAGFSVYDIPPEAGCAALKLQADGKIVMVSGWNSNFYVLRITSGGALDHTFNSTGVAQVPVTGGIPLDILVQKDGKIVVVGQSDNTSTGSDVTLARLNSNGSLDTSFGTGGIVTTAVSSGNETAFAGALQGDGKIVVVGSKVVTSGSDAFVLRYSSNGVLDAGFASGGILLLNILNSDSFVTVEVQSNGKIVAAGMSNPQCIVVRLTSNGSLDTTFSYQGIWLQYYFSGNGAADLALQPHDGKIVLTGSIISGGSHDFLTVRLLGDAVVGDTTPPVWNSSVGLQDAYQVGDKKVRVFWNAASDPESPPVLYNLYYESSTLTLPCTPDPYSGFDCYAEVDTAAGGGSPPPAVVFSLKAVNAVGLQTSEFVTRTIFIYDFKTFAEINAALDSNPDGLAAQGLFVLEAIPLNNIGGLGGKLLDLFYTTFEYVMVFVEGSENFLEGVLGAINLGGPDFIGYAIKEATAFHTFQVLAGLEAGERPILANPISQDNVLPTGKPLLIIGKIIKSPSDNTVYVFEPLKNDVNRYKTNYFRYDFIQQSGFSPAEITSPQDLLCYNADMLDDYQEKAALLGFVERRWKAGSHVYLQLLYHRSHNCLENYEVFKPEERFLVRLPANALSIPARGALVGITGALDYATGADSYNVPSSRFTYVLSTLANDPTPGVTGSYSILIGGTSALGRGDTPPDDAPAYFGAALASPADLHIYDSQGRHFGPLYDGGGSVTGIEEGIPGVIYSGADAHPEFVILPWSSQEGYRVNLHATGSGMLDFSLRYASPDGTDQRWVSFEDVAVSPGAQAEYRGGDSGDDQLYQDADGDGFYESSLPPTSSRQQITSIYLPLVAGASGSANPPPSLPSAPVPTQSASSVALSQVLGWNGGDPLGEAVTYTVQLEAGDTTPDTRVCLGVSSRSCAPGGLLPGQHYYWQVTARDAAGGMVRGPRWDFSTRPQNPPFTPSNPTPTDAAVNQVVNLSLQWNGGDPDGDAVTYDIYLEVGDATPDVIVSNNHPGTSFNPTGLLENSHYYWQVVARDAYGAVTVGPVWQFTTGLVLFRDSLQRLQALNTYGIGLGDLDGDHDVDAFVAGCCTEPTQVFFNNGSGVFSDSGQNLVVTAGYDAAIGDLDGDNDLDAFVVTSGSNADKVFFNNGSGVFSDSGQSLLALSGANGAAVALGDLDGDHDLDAFTVGRTFLVVWLNNGSGTFTQGQFSGTGGKAALDVALFDADGDTDLDMVMVGEQLGQLWLNNGSGIFSNSGQALSTAQSEGVAVGDLDGDHDLDLFITNRRNFSGGVYSGGADTVWLNDGAGHFTDSGQALGEDNSYSVQLGDLDLDGDLDAFVVTLGELQGSTFIKKEDHIWLNNGSSTFSLLGQTIGNYSGVDAALADLDGDGDLDVYVGDGSFDTVWFNVTHTP